MTIFGIGVEVYIINLLIAVPVYFSARWIFGKLMNKRPIQLWMSWISTIVLTPIIYITIALIWMSIYFGHPVRDFDQKKWVENADLRYEMYSDLTEILIGLTKQEVEAMLSQEDPTIYDNDHWQIYMGYGAGLSVDLYYLDIYFENGKVAKVGRHVS